MVRTNLLFKMRGILSWTVAGRILAAAGVIVFIASAGFAAFNCYRIWDLEMQMAQLEQKKLMLRPTVVNMETAAEKQREINVKTNLLLNLTSERVSWHSILSSLSDLTPPRVWLTEAGAQTGGGNGESVVLNLKGRALDYPDIASFMRTIEENECFGEAVLVKTVRADYLGGSQFEIMVKIKKL